MPLCSTASDSVCVHGSHRCKARSASDMQAEHRLNLERQIRRMATRIDRKFIATSDPLSSTLCGTVNELSGWVILHGKEPTAGLKPSRLTWSEHRQPLDAVVHSSDRPGELLQWLFWSEQHNIFLSIINYYYYCCCSCYIFFVWDIHPIHMQDGELDSSIFQWLRCMLKCCIVRQVKRQKAVSSARRNVTRLLNELELSPNTSFEREVVSDGEMVSLTVENMDALKQYNDEVCF